MSRSNSWPLQISDLTDREIRKAIESPVQAIDLRGKSAEEAAQALDDSIQAATVATDRVVGAVARIFQKVRACHRARFPSEGDYYAKLQTCDYETNIPPICLTGPAGFGKTRILRSLGAMLRYERGFDPPGGIPVPIRAYVYLSARGRKSTGGLLSAAYATVIDASPISMSGRNMGDALTDEGFRRGVAAIALDEMQHLASSSKASTLIASTLLAFRDSYIPLVYGCNYSLLHKLIQRPQEDRRRLLENVVHVGPYEPQELGWQRIVSMMLGALPESFVLDGDGDAEPLHQLTAGTPDTLRRLLVLTYRRVRERGGSSVRMDDVVKTYRSADFAAARMTVEAFRQHWQTGKPLPQDLRLPDVFVDTDSQYEVELIRREQRRRVAFSVLNVDERARLAARSLDTPKPASAKKAKRRRALPTEAELRAGLEFAAKRRH